jgi:hypothetical protein
MTSFLPYIGGLVYAIPSYAIFGDVHLAYRNFIFGMLAYGLCVPLAVDIGDTYIKNELVQVLVAEIVFSYIWFYTTTALHGLRFSHDYVVTCVSDSWALWPWIYTAMFYKEIPVEHRTEFILMFDILYVWYTHINQLKIK